ncbi:MAG: hypothetical protein ACRDVN_07475 [Jiangellaceae bacterium]
MLTFARRVVLAVVPAGLITCALTLPAHADCESVVCPPEGDGSDAGAGGGTVYIQVWGSGVRRDGGGVEVPLREVGVHPPCWMEPFMTGAEYYDYVTSGRLARDNFHFGENIDELPGYEQHQDDTEGQWWAGICNSGYFDGTIGAFFDYTDQFFDENPPVFVEVGEDPPVPPIPPEILVEYAYREMDLPAPQIGWNPRRVGDAATFVNLDTWVWLEDGPVQLEVNAAAGGNVARVEATIDSMRVTAPDADPVTCDGTGVPWSSQATGECAIVFGRSSATQPGLVTPVTVATTWTVEWFANGAPRGPLDPQTTTGTTTVPVAEVQTVVTGTR